MNKSRQLFEKAKTIIAGGVNSPVRFYEPYPFFATRAKGSKIHYSDGNRYIDYCMGYGALLLGHNHKTITNSVKSQLAKGSLFCTPTEKEVELAELMIECIPCAEMVRLVNTYRPYRAHGLRWWTMGF